MERDRGKAEKGGGPGGLGSGGNISGVLCYRNAGSCFSLFDSLDERCGKSRVETNADAYNNSGGSSLADFFSMAGDSVSGRAAERI